MGTSTKTNQSHLSPDAALAAFRAALAPQEGAFMRGVSLILNDPKDQTFKPHRGGTSRHQTAVLGEADNERTARAILERAASGQFTSAHAFNCKCDKCYAEK